MRRLFAWEQQVDNFSLTYYYIQNKCIIVGKIVEEGTHKDLIKIKNGYYRFKNIKDFKFLIRRLSVCQFYTTLLSLKRF